MKRALLILVAYIATLTVVVTATARDKTPRRVVGHGQIRFAGLGPERWAAKWRREHRLNIALRRRLAARVDRIVWLVDAFQCIHRFEGSWTDTGAPYWGGLQFGYSEWHRFGGSFAPTANLATPAEQIAAGISYH